MPHLALGHDLDVAKNGNVFDTPGVEGGIGGLAMLTSSESNVRWRKTSCRCEGVDYFTFLFLFCFYSIFLQPV